MNYLAHLYLSNNQTEIIIGNFIADAVKGNRFKNYPIAIQNGILHHRFIDSFTDQHSIVKKSKRRLNARYNHYDGVIIDIFYDHFLAKNWLNYETISLEEFIGNHYKILENNVSIFPEKIALMFQYMVKQNWLLQYKTIAGISQILSGMNRRTKGISKMNLASEDLVLNYAEFENDFQLFFNDLMHASNQKLKTFKYD